MPRGAELINQRFGKLLVIKEIPKEERPQATANRGKHWLCQCDCGKQVIHYSGALLHGDINSCGCMRGEKRKIDISGQIFGKARVIMEVPYEKGKERPKFLCECECGNIFITTGNALRTGHTTSCGCKNKVINPDMRFGKLVTIKKSGKKDNDSRPYWICKCDCGGIVEVHGSNLLSGNTQSCGCMRSRGEHIINQFLISNNICFKREYTFSDLRKIYPLRFDFAIFDDAQQQLKCLIEFQGIQHYDNSNFGKTCRETDILKKEYCKQNNIVLYEIKYNDNIIEKLQSILIKEGVISVC